MATFLCTIQFNGASVQKLQLKFSARKVDRKDGPFGKSDPYLVIVDSNGRRVYKSSVIKKTLDPVWESFDFDATAVGGVDMPIKVSLYNHTISVTMYELAKQ